MPVGPIRSISGRLIPFLLGDNPVAVFIDYYGNEARVLIEAAHFGRKANGSKKGETNGNHKKKPDKKIKAK